MQRYGETAKLHKGLQVVYTLKDEKSGELVRLSIWDPGESHLVAKPDLIKTTEKDDFESWETNPI